MKQVEENKALPGVALVYIGNGGWLAGVPARDLTAAEVEAAGGERALLASGLYRKAALPREKKGE